MSPIPIPLIRANPFFFASGEFVAQFKYTVLIMPNGYHKITGLPFEADVYESEKTVEDEEIKVNLLNCDQKFLLAFHFTFQLWIQRG